MLDNAPAPTESELVQKLQASRTQEPVSDNLVETEETQEVVEDAVLEASESVEETEDNVVEESAPWRTLKADGEERGLTEEEYDNYASKGYNYTQKSMAHAEKVKAFEAESAAERAKLGELTTKLETILTEQEQSIDWEELAKEDPSEYLVQKQKLEAKKLALETAQKDQAAKMQAQREQLAAQEGNRLKELMNWKDDAAMNKAIADAGQYMTQVGITDQEQSTIMDHRLYVMAIEAGKYRELMKNKGKVQEQVKKAPPSVKQGQKPPPNKSEMEAARQRLRKSGGKSEQDMVALLRAKRGNN